MVSSKNVRKVFRSVRNHLEQLIRAIEMSAIEIMETHFHSHSHRILRNLDNTFLKKYQKKRKQFWKDNNGSKKRKNLKNAGK